MSAETRLAALAKEQRQHAWPEENKEAIEEYNAFVKHVGVFAEDERLF